MIQALQNKIIIGLLTLIAGSLIYLANDKVSENNRRAEAIKQMEFENAEGKRYSDEMADQNRKIMESARR